MLNVSTTKLLNAIQTKFTWIYVLNCTDILFTYTLLKTGDFYEANFLMKPIVTNPFLSILVKIILPAALILGILPHLQEAKAASAYLCSFFVSAVLIVYLGINFLHVYYFIKILA